MRKLLIVRMPRGVETIAAPGKQLVVELVVLLTADDTKLSEVPALGNLHMTMLQEECRRLKLQLFILTDVITAHRSLADRTVYCRLNKSDVPVILVV